MKRVICIYIRLINNEFIKLLASIKFIIVIVSIFTIILTLLSYNSENSFFIFIEAVMGNIDFLTIFLIALSTSILINEYSQGTIKQILIRPHKRWKILVVKFITIILISTILLLFIILLTLVIGGVFFL